MPEWEENEGLYHQAPDKIYNLQKATQLQRPIRKKQQEEEEEVLDFAVRSLLSGKLP
jgi:hypothetical protein